MRDDRDVEQQSHRVNMEVVRTTGFLWNHNDDVFSRQHVWSKSREKEAHTKQSREPGNEEPNYLTTADNEQHQNIASND